MPWRTYCWTHIQEYTSNVTNHRVFLGDIVVLVVFFHYQKDSFALLQGKITRVGQMQESVAGPAHTAGRLVKAEVNVRAASGGFRLILDAFVLGPIKITRPFWHCLNISPPDHYWFPSSSKRHLLLCVEEASGPELW